MFFFFFGRTFQRGETTVEQQFEIAKLTLAEEQCWEGLCLGGEFGMARQVAGEQILEDAAVRRVGHLGGLVGRLVGS